jgi:hypothetical protein
MNRGLRAFVLVLVVVVGVVVVSCSSEDEPADASSRCESWAEKVEVGETELTNEQIAAIRATATIRGQDATDALAFWAPELCLSAATLELVGDDGSLTPTGLYIAWVCGVEPEDKRWPGCEHLGDVSLRIAELGAKEGADEE